MSKSALTDYLLVDSTYEHTNMSFYDFAGLENGPSKNRALKYGDALAFGNAHATTLAFYAPINALTTTSFPTKLPPATMKSGPDLKHLGTGQVRHLVRSFSGVRPRIEAFVISDQSSDASILGLTP